MKDWNSIIFSESIPFEEKVRRVFKYQFEHNPVYHRYCEALEGGEIISRVEDDISAIPLLPIEAFKDANVNIGELESEPDLIFKSSGTSDMQPSIHQVPDAKLYEESLLEGLREYYDLNTAVIWGYTPGYAENPHSSLIYMIQTLIGQDQQGLSRFLPLDKPLDKDAVEEIEKKGKQLILFGAAFGLLDLLEMEETALPSNSIIIETGGMKTHRRERSRKELHRTLSNGFELDGSRIHSEYGMAELLSQCYATGGPWFNTLPWMQVSIRDPENPAANMSSGEEGLIGVIDLANVHSCSFLLTGDRGMMDDRGRFQVLGRWNPVDLRGCNFLMEED